MYSGNITGYSAAPAYSPSGLEKMVAQYAVEAPLTSQEVAYQTSNSTAGNYDGRKSVQEEHAAQFLSPKRPDSPFIGHAAEIAESIKEAFLLTAKEPLPEDVSITIDSREQLAQQNPAFLNPSVAGLSINSAKKVFVVAGKMDEVMLTVGHELGHVIRPSAGTPQEEEAKAFAFEAAWARAIFDSDVAGLRSSINAAALAPARNGLHDVAFNFVRKNSGKEPLRLFDEISRGSVTQEQVFEGTRLQPDAIAFPKPPFYSLPQLNKSGAMNVYSPAKVAETLNGHLLRKDVEQMSRAMEREYGLHGIMSDGYGYAP